MDIKVVIAFVLIAPLIGLAFLAGGYFVMWWLGPPEQLRANVKFNAISAVVWFFVYATALFLLLNGVLP